MQISSCEIGHFTTMDKAKAYMHVRNVKNQILSAAQEIANLDNQPQDLNVDRFSIAAPNIRVHQNCYGDAMLDFTPANPEKPIVTSESIKSMSFTYRRDNYQCSMNVTASTDGVHRYEFKDNNSYYHMLFTEDRCGNIDIEKMQGYS